MNKPGINSVEKHQILPDYSLEMEYASLFYSDDEDAKDVMTGYFQPDKEMASPKKPLPKTKKLRVLVKRLSRDVVERYQKKKYGPKVGSTIQTSNRPLHRPAHRPLKQQMLMNKSQENIRQIVKSVASQSHSSAAVLNLLRNNYNLKSLVGQKPTGVYNCGRAAASKPQGNTNVNKSNVSIKQPLQTDYTKFSSIKKHETTGTCVTKDQPSSVKNVSVVKMESNSFIEMRKDTIQVKREVNRTSLENFLSNYKDGTGGTTGALTQRKSVNVKKVIVRSVGSNKNQEMFSRNTINNAKHAFNRETIMHKQISSKKDVNIATGYQQKPSGREIEWHNNKQQSTFRETIKQQTDANRTKFMNISSVNKDATTGTVGGNKSLAERPVHPKHLDNNLSREIVKKSLNINQSFKVPANVVSAKIVKQPKMVKVPISKLIKIPQGITISKSTEKSAGTAKSINIPQNFETVNLSNVVKYTDAVKNVKNLETVNLSQVIKNSEAVKNVKHLETVNISKVIKNSDTFNLAKPIKTPGFYKTTNEARSPELLNPPKDINTPQAIKTPKLVKSPELANIVKLPNTQKLTAVKLLDSNTIKNTAKIPETVILSKVVKMSEVDTTAGKCNLKLSTFSQSQSTQTEVQSNRMKTSANCQVKAVQTKFTCNDNICGIIDTAEFNINCFYCYDVFPLRKFSVFIKHMKSSHRLEERSHAVANSILTPRNIIPYGMKSKEVQVNTLTGRNVLGGKRKIDATAESFITNTAAMDDVESLYDSQLENDLEAALNCIDEDETDEVEELDNIKSNNTSSPTKIIKLENEGMTQQQNVPVVESKIGTIPQITFKTMSELNAKRPSDMNAKPATGVVISPKAGTAASGAMKVTDHYLFKNKIINLPANIKIIKRLTNKQPTSGEATKSPQQIADNTKANIVVVPKIIKVASIKTEDTADSPSHNTTSESIDYFSEDIRVQSLITKDESNEFCEYRLDDTGVDSKNDSLDVSKTDVEQNVKIEPDFNNDSGDENSLLRLKDEAKSRTKKYVSTRRNVITTQKSRPIPSNLLDSDDEMPSNDDNEDELPSPTNGCGILFGLTNRNIVMEFINELQKYPELWQFNRNNDVTINYNESIRHLHQHINEKFSLEMTDFEVRLSVQRIKYWYCRTLQKMEKHNKNPQADKGQFRHTFPEYFKKLQKFLSYDSNCTKDLVLGKRFQEKDVNELNRYPRWMLYKEPGGGVGGDKGPDNTTAEDKCSLARDLQFSEDGGGTDQEEEEGYTPSLKPFKSELDTSAAPPDPFICDICFIDFNSMVELTRHRARHFPPQYPCAICKRLCYSSLAAEKCNHVNTKREMSPKQTPPLPPPSPKEQWVCEICGVSYKSVGTLNYHKKDKHFNMRHKCPVCKFTSISNYRMVQHQKKRHVVEFGTCEEIAKKTRARTDSKVPFNAEARREFEWRREMRMKTAPGELFYGCYKCKTVFQTRKEKVQHNREEHPITEATVICLLCNKEKALFSNSNSVRRHYTDVHKVPWDEIDDLVKRTKPLFQTLSPLEVDQLKSSDNPSEFVVKTLAKKLKAEQQKAADVGCEISRAIKSISEDIEEELNHSYDPFKFENNTERRLKLESILLSHDEDSFDDDYYQSSFFKDIGMDHNYDDMQDDNSFNEDDDDDDYYGLNPPGYDVGGQPNSKEFQHYEYQDDDGNEHYIIEEECAPDEVYADIDVGGQTLDQQLIYDGVRENVKNEEEIVEEIVEYDFMDDVMDDRY